MALPNRTKQPPAETPATIQRERDGLAGRSAALQRRERQITAVDLPRAEDECGRLAGSHELWIKTGIGLQPEDVAASAERVEQARTVVRRLREEHRAIRAELDDIGRQSREVQKRYQMRVLLGDKTLNVPKMPDWQDDDSLTALRAQESRLQAQIRDAGETQTRIDRELVEAQAHARTLRVALHTGKGSRSDVDQAEQAIATLQAQLEAAERTAVELREAADAVRQEREARETVLRNERIPALLEQYQPKVAEFLEALVDAAIASERLKPYFGTLLRLGLGTHQLVAPWVELDLENDQSRVHVLHRLARERGVLVTEGKTNAAA